jgi:RNA polymerase sigma-70 factor (ECF subfamily)
MGRRLAEITEIDDVVQETLIDLFRSLDQRAPTTSGQFHLWLVRCVEHNLADRARAGAARKRGGGAQRRFADLGNTSVVRGVPAGGRSPASVAGGDELDRRLEDALLGLRDEHRQVVVLRVLCNLTFAEIAQELGQTNAELARQWFGRALAALRERLGGPLPGDGEAAP